MVFCMLSGLWKFLVSLRCVLSWNFACCFDFAMPSVSVPYSTVMASGGSFLAVPNPWYVVCLELGTKPSILFISPGAKTCGTVHILSLSSTA